MLVEEIQQMHDDGVREPPLVDVVKYLHELHRTFTVELFIRGTEESRSGVLREDESLVRDALTDGDLCQSPIIFQRKAMLFHAGLLEDRGSEPSCLNPEEDYWTLRTAIQVPFSTTPMTRCAEQQNRGLTHDPTIGFVHHLD